MVDILILVRALLGIKRIVTRWGLNYMTTNLLLIRREVTCHDGRSRCCGNYRGDIVHESGDFGICALRLNLVLWCNDRKAMGLSLVADGTRRGEKFN